QAWIEHQVPQCGYCQSGMIMAVAALLDSNPDPTDDELAATVTNICRCGTYERVRSAVRSLAGSEEQVDG
ncbi:MAG: 2Fe-2S iron-sulfur cluster-binding protein, partial [Gemmatimonadota bacterium]